MLIKESTVLLRKRLINPFVFSAAFPYPLKTENLAFSDVFRG